MVMGQSVKQWHEWYDLKFHSWLAQDAVNSMQDWRQSLLGVAAEPPRVPCRRAQIVYTDSESDSENVQHQQPACADHQEMAIAMLQSHPPAGSAPDLSLSTALHYGHLLVSESEESEYQSCCSDNASMADNETEAGLD